MQELTLKHFILKQRVLNLYRYAIRASRGIPDPSARLETIIWIRSEFERNKDAKDATAIEEKLSVARREIRQMLPMGFNYNRGPP